MEVGFLGYGGAAMSGDVQEEVAIGSTVPPEAGAGAEEKIPKAATMLALACAAYLIVFVFHVVTF